MFNISIAEWISVASVHWPHSDYLHWKMRHHNTLIWLGSSWKNLHTKGFMSRHHSNLTQVWKRKTNVWMHEWEVKAKGKNQGFLQVYCSIFPWMVFAFPCSLRNHDESFFYKHNSWCYYTTLLPSPKHKSLIMLAIQQSIIWHVYGFSNSIKHYFTYL